MPAASTAASISVRLPVRLSLRLPKGSCHSQEQFRLAGRASRSRRRSVTRRRSCISGPSASRAGPSWGKDRSSEPSGRRAWWPIRSPTSTSACARRAIHKATSTRSRCCRPGQLRCRNRLLSRNRLPHRAAHSRPLRLPSPCPRPQLSTPPRSQLPSPVSRPQLRRRRRRPRHLRLLRPRRSQSSRRPPRTSSRPFAPTPKLRLSGRCVQSPCPSFPERRLDRSHRLRLRSRPPQRWEGAQGRRGSD
jgi:hypothetical protein